MEETTTVLDSTSTNSMNYRDIITIEPGKRGGKPCIRRMRITVYDVGLASIRHEPRGYFRRLSRTDRNRYTRLCCRSRSMPYFNGSCSVKPLFDQNLSRKLANRLVDLFPDSSYVQFHNMPEADDAEIWEFAKANDFCMVTQDTDFADRSRLYGSPPKVVWLRCGNTATSVIEKLLREGESAIHELIAKTVLDCLELY